MKKNEKGFSVVEILIVLIVVGLIGTVGWLVYNRQNNETQTQATEIKKEKNKEQVQEKEARALLKGTFGESGDFGSLQAEGYATVAKRSEAFCEHNCKQHDYVFFTITKAENTSIFSYLKNNSDGSFTQDNAIGIGCIENDQISYSNSSDSKGFQNLIISSKDTATILSATADKPVALELEKLKYTSGVGAPDCYSHFTTIQVLAD